MKSLSQLWDLAEREAAKSGTAADAVFDKLGLTLQHPLENYGYYNTPINSSSFATTGGDGVHYSLLHIDGEVRENSPVVMTVPMMFEEGNLILGENLLEFLALGCRTGYFNLENLIYQQEETIRLLDAGVREGSAAAWEYKEPLLTSLIEEFDLKPWPEHERRLGQLQEKYAGLILLPPEEID